MICDLSGDEDAGARTGQPRDESSGGRRRRVALGDDTPAGRHSPEAARRPKVRFPAADGAGCKREGGLEPSSGGATFDAPVTRLGGLAAVCAVSLGSLSAPVVGSLPSPAGAAGLVTVLIDPARWEGNPRGFSHRLTVAPPSVQVGWGHGVSQTVSSWYALLPAVGQARQCRFGEK